MFGLTTNSSSFFLFQIFPSSLPLFLATNALQVPCAYNSQNSRVLGNIMLSILEDAIRVSQVDEDHISLASKGYEADFFLSFNKSECGPTVYVVSF